MKPEISIIIVTYNNSAELAMLIPQLAKMRENLVEFIFIDNASRDGSKTILKSLDMNRFRLVENSENRGFGSAVNQGVELSQGDCCLLLNPDCFISEEAILHLHKFLHENPKAAAAAPRLNYSDGKLQPSRGSFPNLLIVFAHLFQLKKLMPADESVILGPLKILGKIFRQYSAPQKMERVDYTTGACVLLRKGAVREIAGFDEEFFLFYEEIDLAKRLKDQGYDWVYLDDAQATHQVGGSSHQAPLRPFYERYRSMILYFRKHHGKTATFFVRVMVKIMILGRLCLITLNPRFRLDQAVSRVEEINVYYRMLKL